jgi:LPS export ABC transporter protein LptC
MALKIFAIAMVLFLAEIVFITTKDFKDNKTEKNDIDFTDIAFEKVKSYLVTKDGCEAKLEAKKILKYQNHAEAFSVKTEFLKQDKKNYIKAEKAILKDKIIHLTDHVIYENNESLQIKSEDLVYNTKTKITTIDSPFTLISDQGKVLGNNLRYDQKNGIIKADNIKYTGFETED